MNKEEQLLTLAEFAEMLRKSKKTARRIIKEQRLPLYKINGTVRIKLDDAIMFIESCRVPGAFEPESLKQMVRRISDEVIRVRTK